MDAYTHPANTPVRQSTIYCQYAFAVLHNCTVISLTAVCLVDCWVYAAVLALTEQLCRQAQLIGCAVQIE